MKRLSHLAVLAVFVLVVWSIVHSPAQWDLKIIHNAIVDYAHGKNPYLRRDPDTGFAFVFPPYILWLGRPLAAVSFSTLARFFLGAKCLACVGLLLLWRKLWPATKEGMTFAPFCLIAFNFSLLTDLTAGNISTFEQLLLWSAIACYLSDRLLCFCALVILASAAKLVLIAFLLLLLLPPSRRRMTCFFVASLIVGLAALATWMIWPEMTGNFYNNVRGVGASPVETSGVNPAALPLIRALCAAASAHWHLALPAELPWVCYSVFAAIVAAVSVVAWRSGRIQEGSVHALSTVFLFCLAYALIMPRFKNYSYILLLLPAFAVMRRGIHPLVLAGLLLLLMLPAVQYLDVNPGEFWRTMIGYSPLILAAILWGVACRRISRWPGAAVAR